MLCAHIWQATVDGVTLRKDVVVATSSSNSFLHLSVSNEVLSPGEQVVVRFNIVNGQPSDGYIYYLVRLKCKINIKSTTLYEMFWNQLIDFKFITWIGGFIVCAVLISNPLCILYYIQQCYYTYKG